MIPEVEDAMNRELEQTWRTLLEADRAAKLPDTDYVWNDQWRRMVKLLDDEVLTAAADDEDYSSNEEVVKVIHTELEQRR